MTTGRIDREKQLEDDKEYIRKSTNKNSKDETWVCLWMFICCSLHDRDEDERCYYSFDESESPSSSSMFPGTMNWVGRRGIFILNIPRSMRCLRRWRGWKQRRSRCRSIQGCHSNCHSRDTCRPWVQPKGQVCGRKTNERRNTRQSISWSNWEVITVSINQMTRCMKRKKQV